MKLYIDGHNTHVETSRWGSIWYKHPVSKNPCMKVKKNFAIGYQTRLGKISRSNELQKHFLKELETENISIVVTFRDAGFLHRSNNALMHFTFQCEEKDSNWGEQRLQELLDKIIEMKAP